MMPFRRAGLDLNIRRSATTSTGTTFLSSIVTNTAALAALQSLSATQVALAKTQCQLSSGLRVSSASDSAAYWSIASTLRSDVSGLSSVSDALTLGSSVLGVAAAALNSALASVSRINADLVTAQQSGVSLAQVQTDISAQQRSIVSVLSAASFDGVNLLDKSSPQTVSFVTSLSRRANGTTMLGTIGLTFDWKFTNSQGAGYLGTGVAGPNSLLGIPILGVFGVSSATTGQSGTDPGAGTYSGSSLLGFDITKAGAGDLANVQAAFSAALPTLTGMAAQIATVQTTIANQQAYVASLSDALTSGIGSLVDADMNVTSLRLQALQAQQELGVQSLSIANQNSQLVLKLFGS